VLAAVRSATLIGVDGQPVTVEVHVSSGLPAYQVVGLQRAHGLEDTGFLTVYGSKAPRGRRLHGEQRDDLEEVVLHHVAQTAGSFIKRSAAPHAEILG